MVPRVMGLGNRRGRDFSATLNFVFSKKKKKTNLYSSLLALSLHKAFPLLFLLVYCVEPLVQMQFCDCFKTDFQSFWNTF